MALRLERGAPWFGRTILRRASPACQTAEAIRPTDAIRVAKSASGPHCHPMVSEWLLADPLGMRQSRSNGAVSTYRVFVRDLVLDCRIGVNRDETLPQRIRVTAELVVADEPD